MPASAAPAADVAVLGAGVVGLTIAYECARRGARVVVLDAGPDIGNGCSYANAGVLAPAHVGPLATPALLVEGARQVVATPPAVRVRPRPSLAPWLGRLALSATPTRTRLVAARMRELAHRSVALHAAYAGAGLHAAHRRTGAIEVYLRSAPAGLLDAGAARTIEPGLGDVRAARHHSEEWVVESRAYLRGILDAARRLGADVRFGHPVTGLVRDRHGITGVNTPAGLVRAGEVVVAAGLGTARLAAGVGLRLPVRGGRGYVVDLAVDGPPPRLPVRLKEHRVVVTPLADRVRVCGLMEFGAEGRPIDRAVADAMVRVATRALPGLALARVLEVWAGERPCVSDGAPVIGRADDVPGLTFAAGHGMWGLVLAPVTAELVAAGLLDGAPTLRESSFSPNRFGQNRFGRQRRPEFPAPVETPA